MSSSNFTQTSFLQYAYRVDGLTSLLQVAGQSKPFAWTYTNAGKQLTESDPLTGTAVPGSTGTPTSPAINPHTLVSRSSTYDQYGRMLSLQLPNTGTYSSMAYDAEGDLFSSAISYPAASTTSPPATTFSITSLAFSYDVRGEEIAKNANGLPAQKINYLYGATCGAGSCNLGSADPYTGTQKFGPAKTVYCPSTGITSNIGTLLQYDANGRQVGAAGTYCGSTVTYDVLTC